VRTVLQSCSSAGSEADQARSKAGAPWYHLLAGSQAICRATLLPVWLGSFKLPLEIKSKNGSDFFFSCDFQEMVKLWNLCFKCFPNLQILFLSFLLYSSFYIKDLKVFSQHSGIKLYKTPAQSVCYYLDWLSEKLKHRALKCFSQGRA